MRNGIRARYYLWMARRWSARAGRLFAESVRTYGTSAPAWDAEAMANAYRDKYRRALGRQGYYRVRNGGEG